MAVRNIPGYKYLNKRNGTGYLVVIILIFILGVAISLVNWQYEKNRSYNNNIAKYNQDLNASKSIITTSVSQYALLLDDGSSLLNVDSNNVTQAQWLSFFQSYNFPVNYPAVDSVNFAQYVTASQVPSYLSNLAAQGQTNFTITPAGNRSVYVPLTYIGYVSPVSLASTGLDLLSNPVRATAIMNARDSGALTMSGMINSKVFHKGSPTFVIYKPIYDGPSSTISQRQSSIYGFVYVGIDSNTFFNTLLANYITKETALQVFDGRVNNNNLLYESPDFSARLKNISDPIYSTVNLSFGGRTWYIRVINSSALIQMGSNQSALFDLMAGIIISLLIAVTLWYFTYYRDRKIYWQRQMEVQAAKDELLSLASHQLRTPATIVKQYLGVILQNYSGSITKEQREIIQMAYDSNERQLEIANQFLNAARFDSGRIKITNKEVILNNVLLEVVSDQRKIASARKQKILFSAPKRQYIVEGDYKYLSVVFENLISNAIKYSKQATKITVSMRKVADTIQITVADQGMGISPEEQTEVFEKFSRASNKANAGRNGTGIGLYLAKQIVDLHGGDIKIDSSLGKGSRFTVILPTEGN